MFHFIFPKFRFKWERWKWNKEYRIYVSTYGNFKDEYKRNIPIKISTGGYVNIFTDKGFKTAHRLVMLTFKPIPDAEDLTVDHLNHNKRDNSIYNLEWVTAEENYKRANEDFLMVNPIVEKEKPNIILPKAGDTLLFKNEVDAFEWAKKSIPNIAIAIKTSSKSTKSMGKLIKRRIRNAAIAGRAYCNFYWKLENCD